MSSTASKRGFSDKKKTERTQSGKRKQSITGTNQREIIKEIEEEEFSFEIDESNKEDTFIHLHNMSDAYLAEEMIKDYESM